MTTRSTFIILNRHQARACTNCWHRLSRVLKWGHAIDLVIGQKLMRGYFLLFAGVNSET